MSRCRFDNVHYLVDKFKRHSVVKQVSHRANKYKESLCLILWLGQVFIMQGYVKTVFVSLVSDSLQSASHCVGVTVLTPCRIFRATCNGISRCIGSINFRSIHCLYILLLIIDSFLIPFINLNFFCKRFIVFRNVIFYIPLIYMRL